MKSVLVSFLFLFSFSSFAQNQPVAATSAQIVVTASSIPESVESTPASVSVITKDDIEKREARDVADVLRDVPGVTLARTGTSGKATSIFIRGASSKQALVLWNGIEMNNAYLSGYDFGQLSTAGVEKVEVVRGPYSALYGSEAVAGVVNVLTVPARSGFNVLAEGGENGLRNGMLDGALVSGIWNAYGSAERRNDDGFAPNDDYSAKTFVAGVQASVNPNFSAGITARYNSNEIGIPYNVNADSTSFVPSPNRRQSGTQTQISIPLQLSASGLHYDLRLGDNEHTEHFNDPDPPFGAEFGDTDISTRTGRLSIQSPSTAAGVFTFGGDVEHAHVDHTDSFGLDIRNQSRNSHALFIEDRASLPAFGSRFEIAAGARYDHFDTFGSQISPRMAIAFVENSRKWRAAYGQGFRAPAIGELYAPFFGNPDLDAEHSDNFELGFDQYVRSATISVTAFHSTYRDLISFDTLQSRFGNIDRANARGIEVAASRAFGDFHAALSYTWQKVVDSATHEPLVRRPENSGSLSLAWDRSAFSTELVVTYAGERRDVTDLYPFGFVSNGAYTTADIVLKYQIAAIAPFVKVENATDERYEEVFGYPSPRRRFIAGIRYAVR